MPKISQPRRKRGWGSVLMILVVLATAALASAAVANAETLEELKREIEERHSEIRRLEEDAKKFREEIAARQQQAKTLSGELARIDRTIAAFRKDIAVTEIKVSKKELEIGALAVEIREKRATIEKLQAGLGAVVRALAQRDGETMLAVMVKHQRLSDFLREFDQFEMLQDRALDSITELRELREELEDKKGEAEKKKTEFEDLEVELRQRRSIQEEEKRARGELLATTKNQEKKYQELLREREARRAALEEEIREIEGKIRVTIDPSLLPSKGRGVLGFPLPNMVLAGCRTNNKADPNTNCITQYFGYTSFAAIGGYNGKGHNGADFRAEVATQVFAADDGVVTAVGDTDIGCRRVSYGKWILIRHTNNLSTLYAHLSAIGVSAGQEITRGKRIGYSGISGYATGPHLHFSVFATQAVRVENIRSRVCGTTMTVPIAAINGYLNPLDYL